MANKISQQLPKNPEAIKLLREMADQGFADKKIQDRLEQEFGYKWSLETVRRARRKIGINKNGKEPLINNTNPTLSVPPPGLTEQEKSEWFRDQFKKNHLFKTLKDQFTKEEINGYLQEYGDLCTQFADIVFSEFFQIDDLIKHRILINRQLTLMKIMQDELTSLAEWIAKNPSDEDESKTIKQERISKFRDLEGARNGLNKASERYDRLVGERNKIYQNLSATRKDRIDELRGGKESFFSLVASLQGSEAFRDQQGKYAELTKLASEDIKNAFRKDIELADGNKEPLIMDEETFLEEAGNE